MTSFECGRTRQAPAPRGCTVGVEKSGLLFAMLVGLGCLTACEDISRNDVNLSIRPASIELRTQDFCPAQDGGTPDGGGLSACEQEFTLVGLGSRGIPAEGTRVSVRLLRTSERALELVYGPGCTVGSEEALGCVLSLEGQAHFRVRSLGIPTTRAVTLCAGVVGELGKRPNDEDTNQILQCDTRASLTVKDAEARIQGVGETIAPERPYQLACDSTSSAPCETSPRHQRFRIAITRGDGATPAQVEEGLTAQLSLIPQPGSRFGDAWLSTEPCTSTTEGQITAEVAINVATSATSEALRVCTSGAPGRYTLNAQVLGASSEPVYFTSTSIEVAAQPAALQVRRPVLPTEGNSHLVTFEVRDCRSAALPRLPFTLLGADGGTPGVAFQEVDAGPTAHGVLVTTPDAGTYPFTIAVEGAANTCPLSVETVP